MPARINATDKHFDIGMLIAILLILGMVVFAIMYSPPVCTEDAASNISASLDTSEMLPHDEAV